MSSGSESFPFLAPPEFLAHWQMHRRVTRRAVEAFPENQLFRYREEPMRSFGEMALELIGLAAPMVRGIATGDWDAYAPPEAASRAQVLDMWDEATREIDEWWPRISPGRFHERMTVFGQYEAIGTEHFLYVLENEIHHRAQGYVYLRALGVEPPAFWESD